jgi:hypothetical protein
LFEISPNSCEIRSLNSIIPRGVLMIDSVALTSHPPSETQLNGEVN